MPPVEKAGLKHSLTVTPAASLVVLQLTQNAMLWDSHGVLTTKRTDLGSDRLQHRDTLGIPMVSLYVGQMGQIGQLGPGIWQSPSQGHLG